MENNKTSETHPHKTNQLLSKYPQQLTLTRLPLRQQQPLWSGLKTWKYSCTPALCRRDFNHLAMVQDATGPCFPMKELKRWFLPEMILLCSLMFFSNFQCSHRTKTPIIIEFWKQKTDAMMSRYGLFREVNWCKLHTSWNERSVVKIQLCKVSSLTRPGEC